MAIKPYKEIHRPSLVVSNDAFYESGSSGALGESGDFDAPLRNKVQIDLEFSVNTKTRMPGTASSFYYFNFNDGEWNIPAGAATDITDPFDKLSFNTRDAMDSKYASSNNSPDAGVPGSAFLEDKVLFDTYGLPVVSGNLNVRRSEKISYSQSDPRFFKFDASIDTDWRAPIHASPYGSFAFKSDDALRRWGRNAYNTLNLSYTSDRYTTVAPQRNVPSADVVLEKNAVSIVSSSGVHTVVIDKDGNMKGWGSNHDGQLGLGANVNRHCSPSLIEIPSGPPGETASWTTISLGKYFTLAIDSNKKLWAWGDNARGQLGDGTLVSRSSSVKVSNDDWDACSAGSNFSVAIKSDKTMWAWGDNAYGQLGINSNLTIKPTLTKIDGEWKSVDCGLSHVVAVKNDGSLWQWGRLSLAGGESSNQTQPLRVGLDNDWVKAVAGGTRSHAFKTDGSVWEWASGGILTGSLAASIVGSTPCIQQQPVQIDTFISCSSGTSPGHALLLNGEGEVFSWGYNDRGQVGKDTVSQSSLNVPTRVDSFSVLDQIVSCSVGSGFSVALKADGTVLAWGNNTYGQLGDKTATGRSTPTFSSDVQGITSISAGEAHVAALKSDGSVWTWGLNGDYQLGRNVNSLGYDSYRLQVANLGEAKSVAAGGYHTVAVVASLDGGIVYSWGKNNSGQLGNGNTTTSAAPVRSGNITGVISVSAGSAHTLALKGNGTVWAWGYNYYGQLGDSTTTNRNQPVQVSGLSSIASIASGRNHNLALKDDGTVWAWGLNSTGQLGDGTTTNRIQPVQVSGLTDVVAISCGPSASSFALKRDGSVWSWGDNSFGQLGDGTNAQRLTPVKMKNVYGAIGVAGGDRNSAILLSNGTVLTVGRGVDGGLGNGKVVDSTTPVQARGHFAKKIAAGCRHSLALRDDGTVWAWGYNDQGQLGDGSYGVNFSRPGAKQVSGLSDVKDIAAGQYHSLAVKNDGTVWGWGNNNRRQLSPSSTTQLITPVQGGRFEDNSYISNVVALAGGDGHTLVLKVDGTVWAWGSNRYGQLGNNGWPLSAGPQTVGYANFNTPDPGDKNVFHPNQVKKDGISFLTSIKSIAAGAWFSVALDVSGQVWTWGKNDYRQCGRGGTNSSFVVAGRVKKSAAADDYLTNIVSIAAMADHVLALDKDNNVWAWGRNDRGQLGIDSITSSEQYAVRVDMPGSIDNVKFIGGGGIWMSDSDVRSFSIFGKIDGRLYASGDNKDGQLGINTANSIPEAYPVESTVDTKYLKWDTIKRGAYHAAGTKTVDGFTARWTWGAGKPMADASGILKNPGVNGGTGQLGQGTNLDIIKPTKIVSLDGWTQIEVGLLNTLALKNDGSLWIAGCNAYGQLGQNTIDRPNASPTNSFVQIPGNWTKIYGGNTAGHFFAKKSDGTLWAWGLNHKGQLGTTGTNEALQPIVISPKSLDSNAWKSVSTNASTLIESGLHEYGSYTGLLEPSFALSTKEQFGVVDGLPYAADMSNHGFTIGIKTDGRMYACGFSHMGCLGPSGGSSSPSWVQIGTSTNWKQVSAGAKKCAAVKTDGTLWQWGGSTADTTPVQVGVSSNWDHVVVSSTGNTRFALDKDNYLYTWGQNESGQLGLGDTSTRSSPTKIGSDTWKSVTVGETWDETAKKVVTFVYGIKSNDTLWTWGKNPYASNSSNITSPSQVGEPSKKWVSVSASNTHVLALDDGGAMWVLGKNQFGELGDRTYNSKAELKPLLGGISLTRSVRTDLLTSNFPNTPQRNRRFKASADQTFTIPTNIPFLIEKVHINIPMLLGHSWFSDKTTTSRTKIPQGKYKLQGTPLGGSSKDSFYDEGGPGIVVSLFCQKSATERDLIASKIITHELDSPEPVLLKSSDATGQLLAKGIPDFIPNEKIPVPDAVNDKHSYTGSISLRMTADISNGIKGLYTNQISLSPSEKNLLSELLEKEYLNADVVDFSVTQIDPFGRSMSGFSPSGGSIFGGEYVTAPNNRFGNPLRVTDSATRSNYVNQFVGTSDLSACEAIIPVVLTSRKNSPYMINPGEKLVLTISKARPAIKEYEMNINHNPDDEAAGGGRNKINFGNAVALSSSYVFDVGESGHDVQLSTGSINITFYGSYISAGSSILP